MCRAVLCLACCAALEVMGRGMSLGTDLATCPTLSTTDIHPASKLSSSGMSKCPTGGPPGPGTAAEYGRAHLPQNKCKSKSACWVLSYYIPWRFIRSLVVVVCKEAPSHFFHTLDGTFSHTLCYIFTHLMAPFHTLYAIFSHTFIALHCRDATRTCTRRDKCEILRYILKNSHANHSLFPRAGLAGTLQENISGFGG